MVLARYLRGMWFEKTALEEELTKIAVGRRQRAHDFRTALPLVNSMSRKALGGQKKLQSQTRSGLRKMKSLVRARLTASAAKSGLNHNQRQVLKRLSTKLDDKSFIHSVGRGVGRRSANAASSIFSSTLLARSLR